MKHKIVRLHRFLFIIPIVYLAGGIEHDPLRLGFIVALSFITSRLFPIVEILHVKDTPKQDPK